MENVTLMQKDLTSTTTLNGLLMHLYIRINTENNIIYVAIFNACRPGEPRSMLFAGVGSRRLIIFILITLKELLDASIEVTEDSEFTIMSQEINELAQCVEG